jgi:hypothetical protein
MSYLSSVNNDLYSSDFMLFYLFVITLDNEKEGIHCQS